MTEEDSLVLSDLNQDLQDELELLKEIFFKEIKLALDLLIFYHKILNNPLNNLHL